MLDYNKNNALHTKTIIRTALIDMIQKRRRSVTEWNVQIVI